MKKIIIIILIILPTFLLNAQNIVWQPLTREIKIIQGDSTILFHILINQEEIRADYQLNYFWHNKGQININQGAYSGDLLHGKYEVYNKEKKLVTMGQFNYGLQSGKWLQWYGNGKIKQSCTYSKGSLNGDLYMYDKNGVLEQTLEYKNGELAEKEYRNFQIFNLHKTDSVPEKKNTDSLQVEDTDNEQQKPNKQRTRKTNKE